MFSKFFLFKEKLGFSNGLHLYLRFKIKKFKNLKVNGIKHPVSCRNNAEDKLTFKEVFVNEIYALPPSFTPTCIIDGGGNVGFTACYFASKYPTAKIITIEPDAENFEILKANVAPYKNVIAIQAGVWSKNINLIITNPSASSNSFIVAETTDTTQGFKSVSIESIVNEYNLTQIDVLKLDVETSEKEIFTNNYDSWLPNVKILNVETHDRFLKGCSKAVFSAVSKYNFSFEAKGENCIFYNDNLL